MAMGSHSQRAFATAWLCFPDQLINTFISFFQSKVPLDETKKLFPEIADGQ